MQRGKLAPVQANAITSALKVALAAMEAMQNEKLDELEEQALMPRQRDRVITP